MSMTMLAGFFSLFGFGLIVAFLGSIKLKLVVRIGADNAQFGRILAAFQWIMVIMAIAGGIAIDNVGHQAAISAGALLAATAIFLIGRVRNRNLIFLSCALLGLGGQLLYAGGNTLLPALFEDPSAGSSLGNAVFGLGALLMSLIITALFQRMSFERALTFIAFLVLTPLFFALAGEFPTIAYTFELATAFSLLTNHVTWIAALVLFCYIGLEVSMGAWITSLAVELDADETQAIRTLSFFLVAMMLSRLFFGLQDRITGIQLTPIGGLLLIGAGVVATVALSGLVSTRSLRAARGWIFLIGFVFGPIFPTTIGMTLAHFAPSTWGTLFGVIATGGSIGAALIPVWIGRRSTTHTVQSSFGILRRAAFATTAAATILSLLR